MFSGSIFSEGMVSSETLLTSIRQGATVLPKNLVSVEEVLLAAVEQVRHENAFLPCG